ncbi:MAG: hypothetical protein CALGDGBN_02125 [Pseudomonadales bacterium]|nr:hypothetical protein [Pseudomonadales bacterium]
MRRPQPPAPDATDTGIGVLLADTGGFLRYLGSRINDNRTRHSASALTFVSLFALVPMLTVFYAILSLVPAFAALEQQIQDFVFRHFVPSTGAEVQAYLNGFAAQARRLTAAGSVLLLLSAWLMLRNIETQFNVIWQVRQHRRGLSSFLIYWAVLSLGPLLIGAGLAISTYLFSLSVLGDAPRAQWLRSWIIGILPQLFSFATFTLMYRVVPNTHVPLRHAALGGLLAALTFEAGKWLFGATVSSGSYTLIYGTFAALPLFLLWLHISWQILLAGAEFVHALSSYRSRRAPPLPDLLLMLGLLERLHHLHQQGATLGEHAVLRRDWLFGAFSTDPAQWQRVRDALLDERLMLETRQGVFVLGTDAAQVSLWSLYQLAGSSGRLPGPALRRELPPWCRDAIERLERAEDGLRDTLAPSLAELFTATPPQESDDARP